MDCLGVVEEVTTDGRLIVRCENLPDLGDRVCDASRKEIGTVGRILGPVDAPYASVNGVGVPKGTKLFIGRKSSNAKGKRRNR